MLKHNNHCYWMSKYLASVFQSIASTSSAVDISPHQIPMTCINSGHKNIAGETVRNQVGVPIVCIISKM